MDFSRFLTAFCLATVAVLATSSRAEESRSTSALPAGMQMNQSAPAPMAGSAVPTPIAASSTPAPAAASVPLAGSGPLQAQEVNVVAKGTVYRLSTHIGKANAPSSHGSAFVIDKAGLLITNYHVIQDAMLGGEGSRLLLEVPEGTTPAAVVAVDIVNDIALVRVGRAFDNALQIAKSTSNEAELVYSLGFPGSEKLTFAQGNFGGESLNGFSISGFASLPLNPGMSGGPLLNSRAEVIGVNRAIVKGAQNLSFFSPLGALQEIISRHGSDGRSLASITGNWKKEAVALVQKYENAALFGKAAKLTRQQIGEITFSLPLPNQVCGQGKIGGQDEGQDAEFFLCKSRSLTPLVGDSGALEVTTYAMSANKATVKISGPLYKLYRTLYEKERLEILRGSRVRRPASLTTEEMKARENCSFKNVRNSKGVDMTVAVCSVANAFFEGLFSTFVKVDVHTTSLNSASLMQMYQGLTAAATADVLGQFLESVQADGGI